MAESNTRREPVVRMTSEGQQTFFTAIDDKLESSSTPQQLSTQPSEGIAGHAPVHTASTDHSHEETAMKPVENVNTNTSGTSSSSHTRNGLNGNQNTAAQESSVVNGSSHPGKGRKPPLERRGTVAEIEDNDIRELQRIFSDQTQGINRTKTIVEAGDPAVDPMSDTFDLTKFLRFFRQNLEAEGVEMKKVSVVWKSLNVFGSGKAIQLQKTVSDVFLAPFRAGEYFGKSDRKQILHNFDGIIKSGELCVVLGRPGSGCSTLLKSLTGELHGLETDDSVIHYNGIPQKKMVKEFKGETVYNQEVDKHFPHLTVGQTLEHAAAMRTPNHRPFDMSRQQFSEFVTKVVMAVLSLTHTYNTKVGNDFVRGVSGKILILYLPNTY